MPSEGLAGPGRAERERERLSRPREYLCLYLGLRHEKIYVTDT